MPPSRPHGLSGMPETAKCTGLNLIALAWMTSVPYHNPSVLVLQDPVAAAQERLAALQVSMAQVPAHSGQVAEITGFPWRSTPFIMSPATPAHHRQVTHSSSCLWEGGSPFCGLSGRLPGFGH